MLKVYLVYDYLQDLPVAVCDSVSELSNYLGRDKASVLCSITRFTKGLIEFIEDAKGYKYKIYKVILDE